MAFKTCLVGLSMSIATMGLQDKDKRDDCARLVAVIADACRGYELDYAIYPKSGNANLVKALSTKGSKKAPYITFTKEMLSDKGELLDPWGRPFLYFNNTDGSAPKEWKARNKSSFDLYSFGSDGTDNRGAGDDVANWK